MVYIPIVPTRLGDIYVTVHASTLIGQDQITRKLHVEVSLGLDILIYVRFKKKFYLLVVKKIPCLILINLVLF